MPSKKDRGLLGDVEQRRNGKTHPAVSRAAIDAAVLTAKGEGGEASHDPLDLETLRTDGSEPSATQDAETWDLDALRLSQDFDAELGGQKLLTVVPVRKPKGREFFRVRPEEGWRFPTAVFTDEETKETFLVAPDLREELGKDVSPVMLFTCLSRDNVLFLWPAKLPTPAGIDSMSVAVATSLPSPSQPQMFPVSRIASSVPNSKQMPPANRFVRAWVNMNPPASSGVTSNTPAVVMRSSTVNENENDGCVSALANV